MQPAQAVLDCSDAGLGCTQPLHREQIGRMTKLHVKQEGPPQPHAGTRQYTCDDMHERCFFVPMRMTHVCLAPSSSNLQSYARHGAHGVHDFSLQWPHFSILEVAPVVKAPTSGIDQRALAKRSEMRAASGNTDLCRTVWYQDNWRSHPEVEIGPFRLLRTSNALSLVKVANIVIPM